MQIAIVKAEATTRTGLLQNACAHAHVHTHAHTHTHTRTHTHTHTHAHKHMHTHTHTCTHTHTHTHTHARTHTHMRTHTFGSWNVHITTLHSKYETDLFVQGSVFVFFLQPLMKTLICILLLLSCCFKLSIIHNNVNHSYC